MTSTPSERRAQASMAAHTRWAHEPNRSAATAAARRALDARFEREVDPEGNLPAAERARRAENARRAYYTGLALRSSRARRLARELTREADSADAQAAGGDAA